ncbi:MAG: hypothetical protein QOH01_1928 [Verrucomicrobiota bacterium]
MAVQPSFGQAGNDNPGGVTNEYHGSSEVAGQLDPYTGNGRREIDDIAVPGSIGAYPLKFTRILTTRGGGTRQFGEGGGWTHSYVWSLWIRPPDENYCEEGTHNNYCGPVGGLTYPGGGGVEFWTDDPEQTISGMNGKHGPDDKLITAGSGYYELRRADGGRVLFRPAPVANTYQAYQILDPYGQATTLDYDASGKLSRVTEPGGRYLEFFYQNFSYWTQSNPSMLASEDVISMVRSNDGRGNVIETVSYEYEPVWITYAAMSSRMYNLKRAYYDDGSWAFYSYEVANTDYQAYGTTYSSAQVLHSCDDPRYAGPMKQIQYQYVQRGEAAPGYVARGQVKAEQNLYGQIVTQVTFPTSPNDPTFQQRTETRGDGHSRFFNYLTGPTPYEFSSTWTDFKNQTFTDTTVYNLPGWRITDARNNATTYETEPVLGALRKITHPGDGSTREYTFSDPANPRFHSGEKDENGNWTYFDRDGNNRVWQTRYPDGGYEQFFYNGFGQVVDHRLTSGGWEHFDYDYRGLKTAATDPFGNVTHYNYYWNDRLQNMVDPYGNATWYEYNQRGQITKVTHQDGSYIENAYNADGTLAWTTDELRHATSYSYDEYKRVLTVTNPLGQTTINSYALDGSNPLIHTTACVKSIVSPMNKNVVYGYDENFRKSYQVQALSTPDEAWTWFGYDEVGNLSWTRDPRNYTTSFGYDARNRRTSVMNALYQTTWCGYDGASNKRWETRADGTSQSWTPDTMNRMWIHYGFAGEATVYDHNPSGTISRITDAKGAIYSFGYDLLNRKTSETYPPDVYGASRSEMFWYDAVGNVYLYKNPADDYKHFSYDSRHRERDSWWDWNGPWMHKDFDAASRMTNIMTNGGETTVAFGYDDANRKVWEEQTLSGYPTRRVETWRDVDGNRSALHVPGYFLVYYDYNHRNQLEHIRDGGGNPFYDFSYDRAGNLIQRQERWWYANVTNYHYDELNRGDMAEQGGNGGGIFARSWYLHDSVNREVATWRDEDNGMGTGRGERFYYSNNDQLTNVRYNAERVWSGNPVNWTRSVDYGYQDSWLNRSYVNDNGNMSWFGPNALNQYGSIDGQGLGYDGNFNLTSYNGASFSYDAENHLVDGSMQATYDGLGRCVRRTTSSGTRLYTYDEWNPIVEWDQWANFAAWNMYGSRPDEILVRWDAVHGAMIYKQDHHGNVVALLDSSGNILERYTYDAFGKPKVTAFWDDNDRGGSWYGNRFMFQGREWISELGIYDYRHRMYHPDLGRFLQTDPMGLQTEGEKLSAGQKALFSPGGVAPEAFSSSEMNLYRYCGDDPVDGSDPLGLKPGDPFDTRAEAAKDALLFINPTSKERNAEYGGLTYVGDDGRHYATAPRTDGAGNKVDLRKSPAEMGVPKNAKRVDGDYHTHADFSRAVADRRGLTGAPPKFVPQRAPRGEDGYKSNHFSDTDIHEAFRQFRINPEFRRYLGTPDNKVLMYEPGQGEVGVP